MTALCITDADVAALALHAEARRTLAALGEAELARGAAVVSTVAAYTLAATAAADAAALKRAVEALSVFVTSIEPERQPFVAMLLDAALAAQVETRMAAGLPPHGRRIDGWMAVVAGAAAAANAPSIHLEVSPTAALRYAAASRADDIDWALIELIPVVSAMVESAKRGASSKAQLDLVQAHGLAFCVFPPRRAVEFSDAWPTMRILQRTLERRRPLAAAILAAGIEHGRRRLG